MSLLHRPRSQRRSIRLPGYDYSEEGAYFVTICTKNRECLIGETRNGALEFSKVGQMVQNCWFEVPKHFKNVQLDEFVIMPNHLHGIILLERRVETIQSLHINSVGVQYIEPSPGANPERNKYPHVTPKSIGSILRSFKAAVTRKYRGNSLEGQIWHRNYYEHVIHSEKSLLNKIRGYIINNPINWESDPENLATLSHPDARRAEEKFRRQPV